MLNSQTQESNRTFKTACWTCRGRKVKCDKVLPCRNCVQADVSCSFPPQVRTVQRPKTVRPRDSKDNRPRTGLNEGTRETVLERLNRMEALLKKHSPHIQLDATNQAPTKETGDEVAELWRRSEKVSSNRNEPFQELNENKNSPQDSPPMEHFPLAETENVQWNLPTDDPKDEREWNSSLERWPNSQKDPQNDFVDDNIDYWNKLDEECASQIFFKPSTVKPAVKDPISPSTNAQNMSENDFGSSFPFKSISGSALPILLPVPQRQICWNKYVENVDPLLKILHTPTMEELMSARDLHQFGINPSAIALVQAVCLLSIISMSEEEVSNLLGSKKEALLRTCATLTEQALTKANFLDAQDLSTVQALLLYLYYLKYKEDSRLHSLCSVATYLASRMGLNRDAAALGLPRLQVELRRRTWWQLIVLVDHPDASPFESAPHTAGADTKLPMNVDDSQLQVQEAYVTGESTGFTESSFCLMQYEITRTFNQIRVDRSQSSGKRTITVEGAEQRLRSSREVMESRYFEHSITQRPIGEFASKVVAMILAKRRILMHLPDREKQRSFPSQDAHDNLFLLGIHVLELSRDLQTRKNFEKWRWLSTTYFQWAIASFVLKDLAIRPRSPATKRAWRAIDGLLDHWPESTRNSANGTGFKDLLAEGLRNRDSEMMRASGLSPGIEKGNTQSLQFTKSSREEDFADKRKRREAMSSWMDSPLPIGQQILPDFSSLSHSMDFEKYDVSDLVFDQNSFNFDFRHLG